MQPLLLGLVVIRLLTTLMDVTSAATQMRQIHPGWRFHPDMPGCVSSTALPILRMASRRTLLNFTMPAAPAGERRRAACFPRASEFGSSSTYGIGGAIVPPHSSPPTPIQIETTITTVTRNLNRIITPVGVHTGTAFPTLACGAVLMAAQSTGHSVALTCITVAWLSALGPVRLLMHML
jgi:hypothetical protein